MNSKTSSKPKSKTNKEKRPRKFSFAINDTVLGSQLNASNLTLPILSEFVNQVIKFLRGKTRQDLSEVKTSIKGGSFVVEVEDRARVLDDAFTDHLLLERSGDLNAIDSSRAVIVEEWQALAKADENRIYKLFAGDEGKSVATIAISSSTNYLAKKEFWADVDLYLYGKVYDLGGKTKPNVHIELENGHSIKVDALASLLARDEENRLYKNQLVRIKAKRNIVTRELKDEQLVSFEYYSTEFDEDRFEKISKKAKVAWKSVESASGWVENLRGNNV